MILELIEKLFGKEKKAGSRGTAKDRMKLMLVQDRHQLPNSVVNEMKEELINVISKYFVVDSEASECYIQSTSGRRAFVSATVPIIRGNTTNGNDTKKSAARKNKRNLQSANS